MIQWMDFVFDDLIGPVLVMDGDSTDNRRKRFVNPSIMEDANNKREAMDVASIQETGQEKRPARMVGLSGLDSAQNDMEVGRENELDSLRWRGGA